jgi:Flp pilus assembly CpaF family ATPase
MADRILKVRISTASSGVTIRGTAPALQSDQIRAGKTILIGGGTATGKTTLLNVLAQAIPDVERVVTIEDTAELPNIVSLAAHIGVAIN